ncbi:MAG TPA: lipoprotein-releasing ABC transporter permease subunit [Vicinamibacterales bacterium]|nr:lipoprotein-releasing ABC transporter permease subunit [Vicinamibacterales bacterium]
MPFELQIALRYLLAKRRQVFISVISLVSTFGVTVGVMALVIALAIMTGLQQELRDRILGAMAHVYVWKTGGIEDYRAEASRLKQLPGVTGAAPAVLGKALASSERGDNAFITLKGIDPVLEREVTEIAGSMTAGGLDNIIPTDQDALPGIVLGDDLANAMGAALGDTVTLITPQGPLTPMGMVPRQRRFQVVGTFRLGLLEFDSAYGFVSIENANRLLGTTQVDHIELRVTDIYDAPAVADDISGAMGSQYVATDWSDMNRSLYSALYLEKIAMGIGIGLIVGVAALNIVASLILLVMEKTRDIAILKTMGASSRSVMLIFLIQGLVIGTLGTLVGASLGAGISHLMDRYRVIGIPGDVYQVTYLPFRVLPWDLLLIVVGAVVVCFFATLYPSRQAAKLDPAQALRYE